MVSMTIPSLLQRTPTIHGMSLYAEERMGVIHTVNGGQLLPHVKFLRLQILLCAPKIKGTHALDIFIFIYMMIDLRGDFMLTLYIPRGPLGTTDGLFERDHWP